MGFKSTLRLIDEFFLSLQPRMREIESLPGKKAIVILDPALRFVPGETEEYERRMWDLIGRFSDHAVRTGTTVYVYNVTGLEVPALFDASVSSPPSMSQLMPSSPSTGFTGEMNWVWSALARRTGGFMKIDNSFIVQGLRSTMKDLNAYYILSFRPEPDAFKVQFNALDVRVKKPDLVVRSAAGFYGIFPDEFRRAAADGDALTNALESPFSHQDLDVRLTSLFFADRTHGSLVRSWILLDTRRLNFLDEGDGGKTASLEAQIGLYRAGIVPVRHRSTTSIYVPNTKFSKILDQGYMFNIFSPPLPPGDYSLRVAVMDRFTKKIGSAYQLVEVPDLKKDRLTLSGILMADKLLANDSGENAGLVEQNPRFGPGGRRFKLGMKVQFACLVYHPAKSKKTGGSRVEYQVRILGEEGAVYTGPTQIAELTKGPTTDTLVGGDLVLGAPLKSGTYMLELTVKEPGSKKKSKSAVQIIDFQME